MKLIIFILFTLAFASTVTHAANRPSKPNILFILADDLGIGNVSCYGSDRYKTPNVDALAKGGIRFTHAYTAPLCGPSRSLILTGRYAFRTGATNQNATGEMKPTVEMMMPGFFKPAGYVTSSVGKWGQLPLGPAEFGFDDYVKFRGSGVYFAKKPSGDPYVENGVEKTWRGKQYMPDLMHEHVVKFLEKHQNEPFFLYYPMTHVHGELVPTPDSGPNPQDLMADNVAYMDKLIGKLMAELDRLKLREKTLVIFMGDNGTGAQWASKSTIGGRALSGQKGSMLEGGALIPQIANWPGVIPAGQVCEDYTDSTDFFPTFAEMAGASLRKDKVIDGHSMASLYFGEKATPRDWIFIELGKSWYVRAAGWKLNEKGELYDMSPAPFEEKLVAAGSTDAAAIAARTKLQAALTQLNPAGGIVDQQDGSGRSANKAKKRAAKAEK